MNKILNAWLIIFILLILPSCALAQDYYSILGSSDEIRWIMRVEVIDSKSNMPIKNVKITLNNEPDKSHILTLGTNSDGIAVILVKEVRYIPGVGQLKVVAPGYSYWEKEIQQWDFFEDEKNRKLYLTNINPWSWTDLNAVPGDKDIINEIINRNFKIWNADNTAYIGPGIFEFKAKMEKIPQKIDLKEGDYEK